LIGCLIPDAARRGGTTPGNFARILECHGETEAGIDLPLLGRQDAAHSLGEKRPFQGNHLRDIGDGLPRKPTLPLGESDVARGFSQAEIGCDNDRDDGAYPTSVE
jgi:hypothetical protein